MKKNKIGLGILLSLGLVLLQPGKALADHTWSEYHWARQNNPFTLQVGNNLSNNWDVYLATTVGDWSASSVFDMVEINGLANPKNCKPTSGRVEVCNSKYGNNGWLGIAQIWVSGSHITKGVTKVNDSYFNKPAYNSVAWKNLVMCQEVGHTLGLDHQDENFNNANLGTCMDYTNNPEPNQHPNQHDFDQLEAIYAHVDGFTSVGQSVASIANGNFENRSDWGRQIRNNGSIAVFEKDFGFGHKMLTHVIFAE